MAEPGSSARVGALIQGAAALAGLAGGVGAAAFNLHAHGFPDFEVFWTAARRAYDPLLYSSDHLTALQAWYPGDGPRPFVYPPTFLLLIWPFGLLPFLPAYFLWAGLSGAAICWAATALVRPPLAAAVLAIAFPVLMAAAYGQSVLFAGAALAGGVGLIDRRPRLAGALIAAAACVKPQLMLLSPLLLLGHWRALGAGVATGLALVASSLVFGPERWPQWLAALPQFARMVRQLPLQFINPLAPSLSLPLKVAVAATGIAFAIWSLRRPPSERIVGAVGGSLCCTLYAVRPDLAIFAPSALAWTLGGGSLAAGALSDWIRRLAGIALLAGLVLTPPAVVAFLLAMTLAGTPALDAAVGRLRRGPNGA